VGMLREIGRFSFAGFRFPHTRGDAPERRLNLRTTQAFSPHAWGCSGVANVFAAPVEVFPTRVGMLLLASSLICHGVSFSPHAWGCSVGVFFHIIFIRVFPTRVGMLR